MEGVNAFVTIRQSTEADWPSMQYLLCATWRSTYTTTLGVDETQGLIRELLESELKNVMPQDDETTLVAVKDGITVGTVTYAQRKKSSYVWGMYVLPEFQRQGVGEKLIGAAKQAAKTSDFLEIRVLKSRTGAVAFYEKMGFRRCGDEMIDLPGVAAIPGVVMQCRTTLTK